MAFSVFEKFSITQLVLLLACLNEQNKSGFFGGPAFIQPANQSNLKSFWKLWLAGKKSALQKATFVLIMYTGYI